ncbi:MAG: mechanosensitive ion channel [Flavobacteriales bacterium]|nr:mechanosensitive ion channel [Flavobacteriales bacterium]HRH70831.1 mechanosensitive ion channel [Flavobacteriales bacterium]
MDFEFVGQRIQQAFLTYFGGVMDHVPGILSGLVVLLIGWLMARILKWMVERISTSTLDPLADRSGLNKAVGRFGGLSFGKLLAVVVSWITLLVFFLAAADIMGMDLVSLAIQKVFGYVPTLFTALAIFVFGVWGGDKLNKVIQQFSHATGLAGGRVVARVLAGIAIIFASITALNVAGVDTTLITANIQIILAGLLLAFAVAYGFAARDILTNILGSYYGSERFKPGMVVRVAQDEGTIVRIDSVCMTLRVGDKEVLIPSSRLVTERIEILTPDSGKAS